jgi:hypothetical protein
MALMVICGVLLLAGVVAVVRWGGEQVQPPPVQEREGERPWALSVRRYVWYLAVAVVAGFGAGVLVAGAGGRLIMRLLAVTADERARGRETEAEEVIGQITTGGTVSFIIFTAIFFGLATGPLYLLIRRWLPGGRLGGLVFGALLLAALATRVEPLRADNTDFGLVGPGWLAASTFGALVLLHGMLVAAIAARYSRALPLIAAKRQALLGYAPLLVLIPAFPVMAVAVLGGGVAVLLGRMRTVVAWLGSRRALVGGRVVLGGIGVAALPGAITAFAEIV